MYVCVYWRGGEGGRVRLVFNLFESDDRRFALLSPIKFIASATSM